MPASIYLATVIDQFVHPFYPQIQLAVIDKFRSERPIRLIEPARTGWDGYGWKLAWPKIFPSLHAFVAWPRPDFTIGKGVFQEIWDCQKAKIPVWIVTNDLEFYQSFDIELLDFDSFRYFAAIHLLEESCHA